MHGRRAWGAMPSGLLGMRPMQAPGRSLEVWEAQFLRTLTYTVLWNAPAGLPPTLAATARCPDRPLVLKHNATVVPC